MFSLFFGFSTTSVNENLATFILNCLSVYMDIQGGFKKRFIITSWGVGLCILSNFLSPYLSIEYNPFATKSMKSIKTYMFIITKMRAKKCCFVLLHSRYTQHVLVHCTWHVHKMYVTCIQHVLTCTQHVYDMYTTCIWHVYDMYTTCT